MFQDDLLHFKMSIFVIIAKKAQGLFFWAFKVIVACYGTYLGKIYNNNSQYNKSKVNNNNNDDDEKKEYEALPIFLFIFLSKTRWYEEN